MDPKDGISHINQTFTKYSNIYKDSKKYLKKIVKIISIIFSSVNLSWGSTKMDQADRSQR
jgi:hypothetical protein